MTSPNNDDHDEPAQTEFDAELADAIRSNQEAETVAENAYLVSVYYNTLTNNDIPHEAATELTCHWVAVMAGDT